MPITECGPAGQPNLLGSASDILAAHGPTILVDIGFDPAVITGAGLQMPGGPVAIGAQPAPVHPRAAAVPALIDTGAMLSCIDEGLAQQLQLPLINQQVTGGVGGQSVLNVYMGYIAIPQLQTAQAGMFIGALLAAGGSPHRAILGRSLLTGMLLVYDGKTGSVKLAF